MDNHYGDGSQNFPDETESSDVNINILGRTPSNAIVIKFYIGKGKDKYLTAPENFLFGNQVLKSQRKIDRNRFPFASLPSFKVRFKNKEQDDLYSLPGPISGDQYRSNHLSINSSEISNKSSWTRCKTDSNESIYELYRSQVSKDRQYNLLSKSKSTVNQAADNDNVFNTNRIRLSNDQLSEENPTNSEGLSGTSLNRSVSTNNRKGRDSDLRGDSSNSQTLLNKNNTRADKSCQIDIINLSTHIKSSDLDDPVFYKVPVDNTTSSTTVAQNDRSVANKSVQIRINQYGGTISDSNDRIIKERQAKPTTTTYESGDSKNDQSVQAGEGDSDFKATKSDSPGLRERSMQTSPGSNSLPDKSSNISVYSKKSVVSIVQNQSTKKMNNAEPSSLSDIENEEILKTTSTLVVNLESKSTFYPTSGEPSPPGSETGSIKNIKEYLNRLSDSIQNYSNDDRPIDQPPNQISETVAASNFATKSTSTGKDSPTINEIESINISHISELSRAANNESDSKHNLESGVISPSTDSNKCWEDRCQERRYLFPNREFPSRVVPQRQDQCCACAQMKIKLWLTNDFALIRKAYENMPKCECRKNQTSSPLNDTGMNALEQRIVNLRNSIKATRNMLHQNIKK